MLDIQLGRRNLSPIQRIAVAEKYRPIYEKQAQDKLREGGRKGGLSSSNKPTPDLVEASKQNNRSENETNTKLAKIANVGKETYRQAKRVLDSENDELKQRVLSGETSISAAYKELTQNNKINICQRGINNPNLIKLGRCIKEFERIYGIQNSENRGNQYKVAERKLSDVYY